MSEQELLQTLIEKQNVTNRLLAMAERRARREKDDADRAKIAERHGVHPSQVLLEGATYAIIGKPQASK